MKNCLPDILAAFRESLECIGLCQECDATKDQILRRLEDAMILVGRDHGFTRHDLSIRSDGGGK
ncbi:hypothetical protein Fuma_06423 [Fuerstiella marisgermanici]|uniref:Uncharacterized protein n=1 Tax=Fuerstiella marisgermanici TaxID=1891926 RepID=A0A1P8WRS1_9PLAN|nr:hypothetical protein Fuma_06423 [Fuerstiella marisgermanici]